MKEKQWWKAKPEISQSGLTDWGGAYCDNQAGK